mmetsp:Transcript_29855/g.62807  ORF Transcript_29855/g.62807 Transcript_29855/m.62807 type:complete len:201 (-) Transcript_29855:90-692(-)
MLESLSTSSNFFSSVSPTVFGLILLSPLDESSCLMCSECFTAFSSFVLVCPPSHASVPPSSAVRPVVPTDSSSSSRLRFNDLQLRDTKPSFVAAVPGSPVFLSSSRFSFSSSCAFFTPAIDTVSFDSKSLSRLHFEKGEFCHFLLSSSVDPFSWCCVLQFLSFPFPCPFTDSISTSTSASPRSSNTSSDTSSTPSIDVWI